MAVAVKCVHYPNWGNRKIGNIPMHDLENWSRVTGTAWNLMVQSAESGTKQKFLPSVMNMIGLTREEKELTSSPSARGEQSHELQCNCKEANVILHPISWDGSRRERGILFLLYVTLMSPLQGYCHNPGPFCTTEMNLNWFGAEEDQQDNVESSWHKGIRARVGPV